MGASMTGNPVTTDELIRFFRLALDLYRHSTIRAVQKDMQEMNQLGSDLERRLVTQGIRTSVDVV